MHSVMTALFPLLKIEFVCAHKEIVQQNLSLWQVRAGQDAPPTVLWCLRISKTTTEDILYGNISSQSPNRL
jgi:hypothetical protein